MTTVKFMEVGVCSDFPKMREFSQQRWSSSACSCVQIMGRGKSWRKNRSPKDIHDGRPASSETNPTEQIKGGEII